MDMVLKKGWMGFEKMTDRFIATRVDFKNFKNGFGFGFIFQSVTSP